MKLSKTNLSIFMNKQALKENKENEHCDHKHQSSLENKHAKNDVSRFKDRVLLSNVQFLNEENLVDNDMLINHIF